MIGLQTDLIVLSADAPGIVDIINQLSIQTLIPFINVCYIEDIAVWGPLVIPGKTGCWSCQNVVASAKTEDVHLTKMIQLINDEYRPPSFGPINTLCSALACLDIIKFLGGYGNISTFNNRIGLWTHELGFEKQSFKRNPECKTCGDII